MSIGQWLLSISALLLAAHFLRRWSEKILLSASVVVVLCGVLFSALIGWLGVDTQLRWDGLSGLILQLLLPMLIFAGACRLDRSKLFERAGLCLYLSVPALVCGVLVCAAGICLSLSFFEPISFEAALIIAFILAASDPFCLSGYFQRCRFARDSLRILEQESVFTDAIVVLGYTFVALHYTGAVDEWGAAQLVLFFAGNLLGEIGIGVACALLVWRAVLASSNPMHRQLIGIACALLSLGLSQWWLITDGLLAVFLTGLACGDAERCDSRRGHGVVLSELIEYLCALLILALFGLSITTEMFERHWPAMLCACLATLTARAAVVAALPGSWLGTVRRRWIFLGYSQCAVPAAIALSLSTQIQSWYLLQSMAYGVATMTLLLRGPALALALSKHARSEKTQ